MMPRQTTADCQYDDQNVVQDAQNAEDGADDAADASDVDVLHLIGRVAGRLQGRHRVLSQYEGDRTKNDPEAENAGDSQPHNQGAVDGAARRVHGVTQMHSLLFLKKRDTSASARQEAGIVPCLYYNRNKPPCQVATGKLSDCFFGRRGGQQFLTLTAGGVGGRAQQKNARRGQTGAQGRQAFLKAAANRLFGLPGVR